MYAIISRGTQHIELCNTCVATILLPPPWASSHSSVGISLDVKQLFCCLPGYQVNHGAATRNPPTKRNCCSGWCFTQWSSCIQQPYTIMDAGSSFYSCFAYQSASHSYSSTFSFSAFCLCFNSQSVSYSYSSTHFFSDNCYQPTSDI